MGVAGLLDWPLRQIPLPSPQEVIEREGAYEDSGPSVTWILVLFSGEHVLVKLLVPARRQWPGLIGHTRFSL